MGELRAAGRRPKAEGTTRPALGGAFVLCVAAAGCASVENARSVQDPASAVPGERTPTAKELGLPTSGALRLPDALSAALAVHPSVLRARRGVEAAEARVGEAESGFLPGANADASLSYRGSSDAGPGARRRTRFESYGFSVSWLLFDFGRTPAESRRAAADHLAAQADEKGASVDVAFAVRAAYYELVKQVQLRDVARESVRQFQEHLDQVREFVRVGTRIPYDQTKAEVDLGNAKLTLVQAEDAVLADQATLANAMGLAETTDWAPDTATGSREPPKSFDECWAVARRDRPSLAAAAAREDAASALVDAQIAALYPRLDVGASFSQSGGRVTPFPWSWNVGPGVSWTPFDGFRNLYTIEEATAALRAARADRAAVEQTAWLETRTSWIAIEDARRRLELAALIVKSAEQNLELARGRYEAGKGTAIELTDAQQALTQARSDEVRARADRDIASSRLWKALGATGVEPAPEKNP